MPTTDKAKELIAQSLSTGTITVPSHVAFGDDDTAFTTADTALGNEFERKAISDTDLQTTTIQWTATLTTVDGNGYDIKEVGLFNASSGGDMFIRETMYPVSKTSSFEYDAIFVMRVK